MTEERSGRPRRGAARSLWQKIVDVSLTDVTTLVKGIDEESIEALEQVLLEADFGVDVTMELVEELERAAQRGKVKSESDLKEFLAARIRSVFDEAGRASAPNPAGTPEATAGPHVILLLGVNGTGKTTTAAKLVHLAVEQGKSVVLAATDTFRSGAQEQLKIWSDRLGCGFVGGRAGGDPAAVAFEEDDLGGARPAVHTYSNHAFLRRSTVSVTASSRVLRVGSIGSATGGTSSSTTGRPSWVRTTSAMTVPSSAQ